MHNLNLGLERFNMREVLIALLLSGCTSITNNISDSGYVTVGVEAGAYESKLEAEVHKEESSRTAPNL